MFDQVVGQFCSGHEIAVAQMLHSLHVELSSCHQPGHNGGCTDGHVCRIKQQFLLLMKVSVVAGWQPLQHAQACCCITIHDTGATSQQLQSPWILFLRHHGATHCKAVINCHSTELVAAPENELLC